MEPATGLIPKVGTIGTVIGRPFFITTALSPIMIMDAYTEMVISPPLYNPMVPFSIIFKVTRIAMVTIPQPSIPTAAYAISKMEDSIATITSQLS
jgi:hypothetical protein